MTLLITILFGLLCAWLLKKVNPLPVFPQRHQREGFLRILMRKTRRGWEKVGFGVSGIAWNATTISKSGPLADEEKDALLRQMLDLDHNADDDEVRQAANALEDDDDDDEAENARREEAFEALGIAANSSAEDMHNAILAVPKWLKELRDKAANSQKIATKALLDLAIHEGRLLPSQREVYETAFNSDFDGTAKKLGVEKPKLNTKQLDFAGRKIIASNAQELGTQVKEAALAYQEKNKCEWPEAWNAQKKDPRFKAYFEQPKPNAEVAS